MFSSFFLRASITSFFLLPVFGMEDKQRDNFNSTSFEILKKIPSYKELLTGERLNKWIYVGGDLSETEGTIKKARLIKLDQTSTAPTVELYLSYNLSPKSLDFILEALKEENISDGIDISTPKSLNDNQIEKICTLISSNNKNLRWFEFGSYIPKEKLSNEKTILILEALKKNTSLESITIEGLKINNHSEITNPFFKTLSQKENLKSLAFKHCKFHTSTLIDLALALTTNTHLKALSFEWCDLESSSIALFFDKLSPNKTITHFNFEHTGAVAETMDSLIQYSQNRKETPIFLNLESTELTEREAIQLFNSISEHDSIAALNLSWNELWNTVGKPIASALQSTAHLQTLNLRNTSIDQWDEVIDCIANNKSLKFLDLGSNHFKNKESFIKFSESLGLNTSILILSLLETKLDDESTQILLEQLKKNTTLEFLCLAGNEISKDMKPYIIDFLKCNQTLKILNLGGTDLWNDEELSKNPRIFFQYN